MFLSEIGLNLSILVQEFTIPSYSNIIVIQDSKLDMAMDSVPISRMGFHVAENIKMRISLICMSFTNFYYHMQDD